MSITTAQRRRIYERNKCRCQWCGIDGSLVRRIADRIAKLRDARDNVRQLGGRIVSYGTYHRALFLKSLSFHPNRPLLEVDHIRERHDGGSDKDSNLQLLCFDCHKSKTSDYAAVRARRAKYARLGKKTNRTARGAWPKGRKIQSRPFPKQKRRLR